MAPNGQAGTWLLDPADLTISSAAQNNVGGSGSSGSPFMPSTPFISSNLNTTILLSALQTGNDTASGSGNITISSPISYNTGSSNTLTLNAYGNIAINSNISDIGSPGALTLVMNTGQNGGTGGVITMGAGNTISVQGAVTFNQANAGALALESITSNALTINVNGAVTQNASTALSVSGLTKITAGSANNITLNNSNSLNQLTIVSANSANLTNTGNLTFAGTSSVANNLTLNTTAGDIIEAGGGTVSVPGTMSLNAPSGHSIILNQVGNNFHIINSSASLTNFRTSGAIVLGNITTLGPTPTLTIDANGAITQASGTSLNIAGATTLFAGAANDITLTNSGNVFNTMCMFQPFRLQQ